MKLEKSHLEGVLKGFLCEGMSVVSIKGIFPIDSLVAEEAIHPGGAADDVRFRVGTLGFGSK